MPRAIVTTVFDSKQAAQSRLNASKARMPDERLAAAANGDAAAKAAEAEAKEAEAKAKAAAEAKAAADADAAAASPTKAGKKKPTKEALASLSEIALHVGAEGEEEIAAMPAASAPVATTPDAVTALLAPEVYDALAALDKRLLERLGAGNIRFVRSAWLLAQRAGFRMLCRQDLEALEARGESPLLQPDEAVALVREGRRGAGVLTYGWCVAAPVAAARGCHQCRAACAAAAADVPPSRPCARRPTRGHPDPTGERVDILKLALAARPDIAAFFWEQDAPRPKPPRPAALRVLRAAALGPAVCQHRSRAALLSQLPVALSMAARRGAGGCFRARPRLGAPLARLWRPHSLRL
jgi:hypothetical protein